MFHTYRLIILRFSCHICDSTVAGVLSIYAFNVGVTMSPVVFVLVVVVVVAHLIKITIKGVFVVERGT